MAPAVAVVVVALAVTGGAYASAPRADPTDRALRRVRPVRRAGRDHAPLPADAAVGIPLADAATQATIDRLEAATAVRPPRPARPARPTAAAARRRDRRRRHLRPGDKALDRAVRLPPTTWRCAPSAPPPGSPCTTSPAPCATPPRAGRRPDDPGALAASYDAAVETGHYALAETRLDPTGGARPAGSAGAVPEARWAACTATGPAPPTSRRRARAAAAAAGAVGTARATYDLVAGRLALDEGRYALAISAYESALAAAPGWHAALAGLGRARAAAGDLVGAEQALAGRRHGAPARHAHHPGRRPHRAR